MKITDASEGGFSDTFFLIISSDQLFLNMIHSFENYCLIYKKVDYAQKKFFGHATGSYRIINPVRLI